MNDTELFRTTPAIKQIEDLVNDVPGWTPIDQLYSLFLLTYTFPRKVTNIVELGSWCGRSSLALGFAVDLLGREEGVDASVHAVDLYPAKDDWYQNDDGSYSFCAKYDGKEKSAYTDQRVWQEPFERDIRPVYERFSGTWEAINYFIEAAQYDHIIKPYRGTFREFLTNSFKSTAQIVFLDGDHSYEAVCRDIECSYEILEPGGIVAFDDAFSYYDGVDQPIRELVIGSDRFRRAKQITRKCFIAQRV